MVSDDRRYSREHEWVRQTDGGAEIGITRFAADELGDIVYVELPAVGTALRQFTAFGVVESVKAVSDLFAPVSGTVAAINDELRSHPELLNSDPEGAGWLCRLERTDAAELDALLDAAAYADLTGSP